MIYTKAFNIPCTLSNIFNCVSNAETNVINIAKFLYDEVLLLQFKILKNIRLFIIKIYLKADYSLYAPCVASRLFRQNQFGINHPHTPINVRNL
jgi:hypothetical protein